MSAFNSPVAALAMLFWFTPGDALAQSPDWVTVERSALTESVRIDGTVEAVTGSKVSAQTSGTVVELPFEVNDRVTEGDLIARLDATEQRSRLHQAESGLAEAEAGLQDARQRFDRIESLLERNVASRSDFDQARNALSAARAQVTRAQGELDEAREQYSYTRIEAPYSGVVTERHVEIGESVNPGQPLLAGYALDDLRVVAPIPQHHAARVRDEGRVTVSLDDGEVLDTGELTLFPFADPGTHTFRLRIELVDPPGMLFPGMLVRVAVPAGERDALWIPEESLMRRGELRAVYVRGDADRPRLRQVRTGMHHDGRIEILSGLSEGEEVATRPQAHFDRAGDGSDS